MKKNTLHQITSSGFKTPENYFESFDASLLNKLHPESALDSVKTSGFKIPDNYFETVDETILDLTVKNKTKVIPLFSKTQWIYASSIAAAVLLLFNLSFFESKPSFDNLDTETIDYFIMDEPMSSYEMALLLDNETLEEALDIDYSINEDIIEEYLLNNADIEALLIE